jgi:hypothetical protein
MVLDRFTPCKLIEIWAPRYKDRKILIAKFKVGTHNEIVFTRAKHLPDHYYLSGKLIRSCPIETNGTIECYAVPVDELEPIERT